MSSKVKYFCDHCEKEITGIYGVLNVTIRSEVEPQTNADLDLCGFDCLTKWVAARCGRARQEKATALR